MYAIVEIAGQQFKVEKEQEVFVHRLEGKAGEPVEFDQVLLLDNDGKVSVGTPAVDGVLVKAKIVEHLKGDKVTVFHKKRRKGYQKENGHRQYLSKILIEDILTGVKREKKEAPKAEVKKETPKAEAPKAKAEDKKTEAKAETKKPAAKKPVKKAAPAKKKEAPKAEKKETPKAEKKEEKPDKSEEK